MESIEHNVGDFAADDRRVFEKVLGRKLQENQRVVIQVIDIDASTRDPNGSQNHLSGTNLDHWAIFQDLSDEEVAELESAILARSPGRDIDI